MDWMQALIVVGANLATIVTLYIHLDNRTHAIINEMRGEMKDFHGRLERQDAEFKHGLARQDAEFKHGMLRLEEKIQLNKFPKGN
jgi:hypothetical protein